MLTHVSLLRRSESLLSSKECKGNPELSFLLRYLRLAKETDYFVDANLCDEDLSGLNLQQLPLLRANFHKSMLRKSNLQRSLLVKANFEDSVFIDADFTDAKVENANFQGTTLLRSNLENVEGLTERQLEKAYLCETRLPQSFSLDPNRDCHVLEIKPNVK